MAIEVSNPEISVIVCIYNMERFLRRSLDSLRHQSMKDFEVLLVDDGSSDRSSDICDSYTRSDRRFRYIYKENGGVNDARATGVINAYGRYLCFLDPDDFVEPDYLYKLHHAIRKSNADIVTCGYVEDYEEYSVKRMRSNNFFGFSNKIFRYDVLRGLSFPSIPFAEDILVFAQIYDRKPKISHINDILYHWVQNENPARLSLPFNEEKYRKGMKALEDIRSLVADKNVYDEFRVIFTTLYAFKCVVSQIFTPGEFRKEFKGCLGMFLKSRQPARRKLILLTHYTGTSKTLCFVRNIYIRHLKRFLRIK